MTPRFGALLELYRKVYDDLRQELGRLEAQRREILDIDAGWEQRLADEGADVAPELRSQLQWFVMRVYGERQRLAQFLRKVDEQIAATHAELIEAHRRLRTIERLRERDRERAHRREMRREAAMLDDLGGQRSLARRVS